jgi:hypothetical protein
LAVQRRTGVNRDGLKAAAIYHAAMPAGVHRFLLSQPVAMLAIMDGEGRVWASL